MNKLKTHCKTSDLTINSIACDINGEIIDYCNGIDDLGMKKNEGVIIRFVGNPINRINEDPLRLLRAVRIELKYGAFYDDDTLKAIQDNAISICALPGERIRDELIKCLEYKDCFFALSETNLLSVIMPEWICVLGMNGGDFHNETVDQHMLDSYEVCCSITKDKRVRAAAFLHDIGKGETQTFEEISMCCNEKINIEKTGNSEVMYEDKICSKCGMNLTLSSCTTKQTHFYQHEKVGYTYIKDLMNELKFKKEDIEFVSTLVRYHMWSYKAGEISKKSYLKMFDKFHKAGVSIYDFMMVIYSDHQGNAAKPRIKFGDFCKKSWILSRYWECVYTKEPFSKKDLALQGGEIIDILKKKPGKWVGDLMDEMLEQVMICELVNDKQELVKWLKNK